MTLYSNYYYYYYYHYYYYYLIMSFQGLVNVCMRVCCTAIFQDYFYHHVIIMIVMVMIICDLGSIHCVYMEATVMMMVRGGEEWSGVVVVALWGIRGGGG